MSYQIISKKLLSLFKIEVSTQTEEDIYLYGIEILLATFINSIILCLIAFLFHLEKEFLCYLFFFIPLRAYSGGIHAKNHVYCFLLFILLLFLSIIIAIPISQYAYYPFIVLFIILCKLSCALIQYAHSKNRKTIIAIIITITDTFLLSFLIICNFHFNLGIEYYIILSVMGIFMQTLTNIPVLLKTT